MMQKKVKKPQSELRRLVEENLESSKRMLEQSKKSLEFTKKSCAEINDFIKANTKPVKPEWLADIEKEYDWVYNHKVPGFGVMKSLKHNYSEAYPSMIIPENPGCWRRRLIKGMQDHLQ